MSARLLSLLVAAVFFIATPAFAERRVALVMGNGDYKNAVKLPNPASDARAMADLLKSMGFEVVAGTDLGREAMAEKMGEFARMSGGADVAIFFYAGHGFQLGGKNLLVPTDADVKTEFDAKLRTIEIDSVLQETMADAKVKIVLLDACRDNPFAKQIIASAPKTRSVTLNSGLAEMKPGEGTLIAFATGPGQVAIDGEGRHSPFTRALLAHMAAPGIEIRHALTLVRAQVSDETRKQQLPWENTNLTGFFYMSKAETASAAAQEPAVARSAAPAVASGFDARTMELELWNSVKASSNPDEYKAYLEKYPNGTFADLARTRVASLSQPGGAAAPASGEIKTAEANAATEDALGLDPNAWRDVQMRLAGLGFGNRSIDGVVGPGTRLGISSWQSARGYPSTGYLNRLQREALLKEQVNFQQTSPAVAQGQGYGYSGGGATVQQRPSGTGYGGNGAGNRAAGEFVGGLIRGASGGRLPF